MENDVRTEIRNLDIFNTKKKLRLFNLDVSYYEHEYKFCNLRTDVNR